MSAHREVLVSVDTAQASSRRGGRRVPGEDGLRCRSSPVGRLMSLGCWAKTPGCPSAAPTGCRWNGGAGRAERTTHWSLAVQVGTGYAPRPVDRDVEWLDVEAAARYLNFHPNTVYRMVREGKLAALRFPVRIRCEDLDSCLEQCRIRPGQLAHLNVYARGTHQGGSPVLTKRGTPDRRYGPRLVRDGEQHRGDTRSASRTV